MRTKRKYCVMLFLHATGMIKNQKSQPFQVSFFTTYEKKIYTVSFGPCLHKPQLSNKRKDLPLLFHHPNCVIIKKATCFGGFNEVMLLIFRSVCQHSPLR